MVTTPGDILISRLKQLDGRTVGLLAYSSNTSYDGKKRIILAEDAISQYHVDYHVEVSDIAFITIWDGEYALKSQMIYDCDNAPQLAIEMVERFLDLWMTLKVDHKVKANEVLSMSS